MSAQVDVIVPVHDQADLTLACISSVVAARQHNRTRYRLVVIDDASSDDALISRLDAFPQSDVTLITNEANEGFVRTANRGMALSQGDVVLLNSDTEVHGDFVDRMRAAAYKTPRVATVTPLTNFGSIAAYPAPSKPNVLPSGWTAERLDALARRVNAGLTIDLPTAVGFCMYVKRACLDQVGMFDPVFGAGYGEEVDLCLRATRWGWRHVLATDVFVWHRGGASFGEQREAKLAESRRLLRARWPRFSASVRAFSASDPVRLARYRLTAARMAEDIRPTILRLAHAHRGGVFHHVRDVSRLCEERADALELVPGKRGRLLLRSVLHPHGLTLRIGRRSDLSGVAALLLALGVSRIHVHHVMGHGQRTRQLLERLDLPVDVTLHDYFFLAPQAHLIDSSGRFAGEPASGTAAEAALLSNSEVARPGETLEEWRGRWRWLLDRADRVIAQSTDCADRCKRHLAFGRIELVQPPCNPALTPPVHPRSPDGRPLRVVAIGALTREKGADVLEVAARHAITERLPLEFHLVGFAYRELDPIVTTHGRYERESLKDILTDLDADVAWFPIRWPETWLQTLSAPLELGLPVVVSDIGAAPERVAGRAWSWVIPWDIDGRTACRYLMAVRESLESGHPPAPTASVVGGPRSDFYPDRYLAPFLGAHRVTRRIQPKELQLVETLTPKPLPPVVELSRAIAFRASRGLLRSRFGGVVRRLPPFHIESMRRLVQSDTTPPATEEARW